MSNIGKIERIKLFANLANTLAAAAITIGVFGPLAAWVYGLSAISVDSDILVNAPIICVCVATALHLGGQALLTMLDGIDEDHT